MRNDQIFWNKQLLLHRNNIKLRGLHNVENVMAAALIALLAGASLEQIGPAVASFPGVEHRIEFVRHLEGVNYFNDSKATNVDASLKAIDAFDNGLWIILGGKDKGSDYTPLREPLERRAKAALLIGAEPPYPYAAAPLIKEALANTIPVIDCGTLDSAVRYARVHAQPGDTVLLAPACASFDQFQNFEERGKAFKQVVKELS
jgi:UDP-N-acetylmuramoylalanine--D-glutamate ligase